MCTYRRSTGPAEGAVTEWFGLSPEDAGLPMPFRENDRLDSGRHRWYEEHGHIRSDGSVDFNGVKRGCGLPLGEPVLPYPDADRLVGDGLAFGEAVNRLMFMAQYAMYVRTMYGGGDPDRDTRLQGVRDDVSELMKSITDLDARRLLKTSPERWSAHDMVA